MSPPVTALYDLARAVLDAAVAHWAGDEPVPAIQFVSDGGNSVTVDGCEILATSIESTYSIEGDPGLPTFQNAGVGLALRAAVVLVTVQRCVPNLDDGAQPPTPEEVETSAALLLNDAQAVWNAVYDGHRAGEITNCRSLVFDTWTAIPPQGGMAGGVLRIRAIAV